MTGVQRAAFWLIFAYVVGALAWLVHGAFTFSGPYLWSARVQLALWGGYHEKLAFIAPMLLIFATAWAAARICRVPMS